MGVSVTGRPLISPTAAAFLEFHEVRSPTMTCSEFLKNPFVQPLAAFLQQENKDKEDTLLTPDELYNNFVRLEITSTTSQPRELSQKCFSTVNDRPILRAWYIG